MYAESEIMTQNVTVVGLQWGDEGKGKVVDALARRSEYVVRYCGGANAGHTVVVSGERYAMHLIPCGILHEGVRNVLGNGVAFDPKVALEEMDALVARGVKVDEDNLYISSAAQVVMPYHRQEDRLNEQLLAGRKLGTTARGIGPCYADRAERFSAIRVGELTSPVALREKIARIVAMKNKAFAGLYGAEPMDAEAIAEEYIGYGERLKPMIYNTGAMLRRAIADGRRVLFEGGQGSMLDVDHGTHPFVTSSSVTACGVPSGAGVPPRAVGWVVGLIKAYTTRVGTGPLPTEQDNQTGEYLRERGREYGTTTGRPRRCGWFDAFAVRYAAELSGVDELSLSLLDVLSGLEEMRICTGYRRAGREVEEFDPIGLEDVECVYEELPGWKAEIGDCRRFDDLPAEAQAYVAKLEKLTGRPVGIISVGPERDQTIMHHTRIEALG